MAMPEPRRLAIDLDLVGGLAGDMFVAALVDALPQLEGPILEELAAIQPAGVAAPVFEAVTNAGLRAQRFGLGPSAMARAGKQSAVASVHAHTDGTSYADLRRQLTSAPLQPDTRNHALALLALLGEAEAHVHGVGLDAVHFHELADWDSLLDLVAAGCIAARLHGARWSASTLPIGGGRVQTAHGVLPVPTPATSHLLTGYPWRDDGIAGERVTPTGAAILRHLVAPEACGGKRETGRLLGIGCGAGTRVLFGMPNIARALVVARIDAAADADVALIEFDIDDMTGEEIALAADRLRGEPGVLDVSVGTRTGKKGRPVADFRVLAQPHAVDAIAQACFTETATLGLRMREERRHVLPRTEVAGAVAGARLRVKVAQRPDGERTAKAAHDDVAGSRGLAARRKACAAGERDALEPHGHDGGARERGGK